MKLTRYIFVSLWMMGALLACKRKETVDIAAPVAGNYQMTEYYSKDVNSPASTTNTSSDASASVSVRRINKETITVTHTIPTNSGSQTLEFDNMRMDSGTTFGKNFSDVRLTGSFSGNTITYTLNYNSGLVVRVKGTKL